MKRRHKRAALIAGIAFMVLTPLVVFAALYRSSKRVNPFQPGSVEIEVQESGDPGAALEQQEYTWTEDNGSYVSEKPVRIKDDRTNPGEELRVSLVPMWFDPDGGICGVFDMSHPVLSGNTLTYTDGDNQMILHLVDGWAANGWEYRSDGCFYYTGALNGSHLTVQLLSSVELNAAAYSLTEDYELQLDVLADAIQSSGSAASTREWAAHTP